MPTTLNLTLDTPVRLRGTHYPDIRSLIDDLFESQLEQSYHKARNAPKEDFVNL